MKTTLKEPWIAFVERHGSIGNTVQALGISRRTFHSWVHGERMPGASGRKLIELAFKACNLEPPIWKRVTPAGNPATSKES